MTHDQTVLVTLVAYELVLVGIGLLAQRRTHDGLEIFRFTCNQLFRPFPGTVKLTSAAHNPAGWRTPVILI